MNWQAPAHWQKITTIDAHTAGEPLRIITSGFPDLRGDTILEKRQYARQNYDHLRRALMWEPRGHADMYGCIFTPPTTPDGDVGVLFLHNEGYSTMCGHGIIGMVKVGIETGMLAQKDHINIDTPAGRVVAKAHMNGDTVERVSFRNVPSFLLEKDLRVNVPEIGEVVCDVAFGGAFYAYVDANPLGLKLDADHYREIIRVGMLIKHAVMEQYQIAHPDGDADLNFLYGTIFVDVFKNASSGVHSRNVCVFADGEVDRSPTGTGVSGRVAIHHARGELGLNEVITIESIIGTAFTGSVVEQIQVGSMPAIIPEVSGTAHITGQNEFYIDPDDPLQDGFFLR